MSSAGFYYNIVARWLTVVCRLLPNIRNCLLNPGFLKKLPCCMISASSVVTPLPSIVRAKSLISSMAL